MARTASSQELVRTLLRASRTSLTGAIRFELGNTTKQLVLRSGSVSFAESNLQEEHIVRILVKLNFLDRKDVTETATLMKRGMTVEEAVLKCSTAAAAGLEQAAREQAVRILASIFSWDKYDTRVFSGEARVSRKMDLRMRLPELLMMAVRRAASGRPAADPQGLLKGLVAPSGNLKGDALDLPLSAAEAYALSLLREPVATEGLLRLLPPGADKPEELIRRLALLGLVTLDATPAAFHGTKTPAMISTDQACLEELLRRFEGANLYEILSISRDAGDAEIKNAYHDLARQYHPDRFQSREHDVAVRNLAERIFTQITGAYATLGDPAARNAYDQARLKNESQVEAALRARSGTFNEREKMAETIFRAGQLSLSKADFDKAASELKECVWLCPDVAAYHHFLGVAQSEIPTLRKEAEQHLLKALQLDETRVDSRLALGKLYLKVNLPRRARLHLNEALR